MTGSTPLLPVVDSACLSLMTLRRRTEDVAQFGHLREKRSYPVPTRHAWGPGDGLHVTATNLSPPPDGSWSEALPQSLPDAGRFVRTPEEQRATVCGGEGERNQPLRPTKRVVAASYRKHVLWVQLPPPPFLLRSAQSKCSAAVV